MLTQQDSKKDGGGLVSTLAQKTKSRHSAGFLFLWDNEMKLPLEGGAVTGTFSGSCTGEFKGTYDGAATVTGEGGGSCGFFLPLEGSFVGVVNRRMRVVIMHISGTAGIKTKDGAGLYYEGPVSASLRWGKRD